MSPRKPQADIVREALEGYASNRFQNQVDVRRFVNSKRIRKSYFSLDSVGRLLGNAFTYAGMIEYDKWEVTLREGHHEALIDMKTAKAVIEKLEGKRTRFTRKLLHPDFPLRGFVLCADCMQPMTASWSRGRSAKYPYYKCNTKGCEFCGKSVGKSVMEDRFESILRDIQPTDKVMDLSKAIFMDVWKKKQKEWEKDKKASEKELQVLSAQKKKLILLITNANSKSVVAEYEKALADLGEKEVVLKSSVTSNEALEPDVETALDIVFDFLKNPLKQWREGDIHAKKLLLKLVFQEQLVHNRKSGFETAHLSLPLRVFALPEAQNSLLVDVTRNQWNQLQDWVFQSSQAILGLRSLAGAT
jgi:hypothetical protein